MSSAATRRWPPRSSRSPNAPSAGRSSTTERPRSFLLVDGDRSDAERVIYELLAQRLITPADILERLPAPATAVTPQNLAARLATLEHQVSDLRRSA